MNFLAIDFETANRYPDSACAVGLVRVQDNVIVEKISYYIKPPYRHFEFTDIHGITWDDVNDAADFGELWNELLPLIDEADFLVAHNASFDRRVLQTCCQRYGIEIPQKKFHCTVQLSRKILNIRPANLPNVCRHLGISLRHHDAASDTLACAKIMIEVIKRGGLYKNL